VRARGSGVPPRTRGAGRIQGVRGVSSRRPSAPRRGRQDAQRRATGGHRLFLPGIARSAVPIAQPEVAAERTVGTARRGPEWIARLVDSGRETSAALGVDTHMRVIWIGP